MWKMRRGLENGYSKKSAIFYVIKYHPVRRGIQCANAPAPRQLIFRARETGSLSSARMRARAAFTLL